MSLYLCVYDRDHEVDGVEVGPYADFNAMRDGIVRELEGGVAGARFPTFILHSDCDGEWSVAECGRLRGELAVIRAEMEKWTAFRNFTDVDGENLIERMQGLVETALKRQAPILFQ